MSGWYYCIKRTLRAAFVNNLPTISLKRHKSGCNWHQGVDFSWWHAVKYTEHNMSSWQFIKWDESIELIKRLCISSMDESMRSHSHVNDFANMFLATLPSAYQQWGFPSLSLLLSCYHQGHKMLYNFYVLYIVGRLRIPKPGGLRAKGPCTNFILTNAKNSK